MNLFSILKTKLTSIALACCLILSFEPVVCAQSGLTPPTVTPGTGTYFGAQSVSMSAPSGSIFYTEGTGVPTNASTPYSGAVPINSPTQINAVAYDGSTSTYSAVTTVYLDVDANSSPIPTSGLVLRLRAGFGVVTGSGNPPPITTMIDLSGAGNNATGTSGSAPLLNGITGGEPWILFNGTTQYLSLPTGFADFTSGSTWFAVVAPLSPIDMPILDLGQGASGNDILLMTGAASSAPYLKVWHDTSFSSNAAAPMPMKRGPAEVLEAVTSAGTTSCSSTALLMGSRGTQNTSMLSIPIVTRNANYIGQFSTAAGAKFYGKLLELLVYNTSLQVGDRQAVREYLIRRYRLNDSIPPAPTFNVAAGTLSAPQAVALGPNRGCGVTRYTLDGSQPTLASPVYRGPIWVYYSETINAFTTEHGVSGPTSSATYSLNPATYPAPSGSDSTAPGITITLPTPNN